MSSINDPQKQDAPAGENDTVGKGVFINIIIGETTPALQKEEDEHDLSTQTAKLNLDENTSIDVLSDTHSAATSLDGNRASATMDGNINPKPAHATTAPQPESEPVDTNQVDEATILANLKEGDKNPVSEESNAELALNDEYDTPRFATYLKLHNDVSSIAAPPAFAGK